MNNSSSAPGVLMLDIEGTVLTALEQELLRRPAVGGLLLFSRNYASPDQLRELVAAIRDHNESILIAVDQEGGRVQRFRDGFLRLPPLYSLGLLARDDPQRAQVTARACGWAMAAELLQYGIDFSFAPVLDLYNANSRVIADRAFSEEVGTVVALARAYIGGMNAAGMVATGKHFPGHGSVVADSHIEVPTDQRSWGQLLASDFKSFAGCIDVLGGIMPAHVIYPAIDSVCAGYSEIWIKQKLRGVLGFGGVVFSDDLTMAAAHSAGKIEARAQLALKAGCDMVLVCNDQDSATAVADWLDSSDNSGNGSLHSMRGTSKVKDLYASEQWLGATELISSVITNGEKVN